MGHTVIRIIIVVKLCVMCVNCGLCLGMLCKSECSVCDNWKSPREYCSIFVLPAVWDKLS